MCNNKLSTGWPFWYWRDVSSRLHNTGALANGVEAIYVSGSTIYATDASPWTARLVRLNGRSKRRTVLCPWC